MLILLRMRWLAPTPVPALHVLSGRSWWRTTPEPCTQTGCTDTVEELM